MGMSDIPIDFIGFLEWYPSISKQGSPQRRKGRRGILICDSIARGDWITEHVPSGIDLGCLSNVYGTEEEGGSDISEGFLFGGLSPPIKEPRPQGGALKHKF